LVGEGGNPPFEKKKGEAAGRKHKKQGDTSTHHLRGLVETSWGFATARKSCGETEEKADGYEKGEGSTEK